MSAIGRVVLLCGGASDEHEVSLASARSVVEAVAGRFEIAPVVLDRRGRVLADGEGRRILGLPPAGANGADGAHGAPAAGQGAPGGGAEGGGALGAASLGVDGVGLAATDVVFPLLHGPYGEDGSVQGLLKVLGIPFVGSGVLASSVGMDKLAMKAVFAAHGLPQVAHGGLTSVRWRSDRDAVVASLAHLAYPRFVKPANLGSSIGIARADDEAALRAAIDDALRYDRRVIVEEAVVGVRELEVAVLGNDAPQLSPVGEIRHQATFYDYATKYTPGMAELLIPADVPDHIAEGARALALRAFEAIDAAGLARVDLFYDEAADRVLVNEINTMPGFTATSMYPKLWEAGGVPYPELIERLVALARDER
jgi:D-alanine-D-alanine ligase